MGLILPHLGKKSSLHTRVKIAVECPQQLKEERTSIIEITNIKLFFKKTNLQMSFGKVVVVKKDGSQGAFFDVTSDVTIGRDKSCDIRIKLSAVSRHHAKMSIDENGHCILESISKTNPTFLNGSTMADISRLQDGDVITVGDRSFIFQNGTIKTKLNLCIH